ncbi:MAG: biopolymer transporter ExbD [Treponema sp.]|nr:biopolymer transporter ExbD [Treponema sp.]
MKLKRKNRRGFLESSASSDLPFLLIIYFIVIAGFNLNTGFLINLPAKDSTRLIHRDDLIRFALDMNGNIIYDNRIITISDADNIISAAQEINPHLALMLTIDPQARWQRVVSFVELAQDLAVETFSFSMRRDTP